ncbi:putative glutamate--cysteine ligase regulatory subunit [Colletotrichum liriopes]|uniref:GCS light chain n=1 Tax=Colletotrichum liriopes TaxID=708192 RepID=A0AA37GQ97_9PEZI|nr:putative glutamate--cysteine ligase regulatory subunit [Colletotrichum liriopes]
MTKLILSTGNIVSGGPSIIRKPGAYRSNLELTNSLRSNFLAAQQDYSPAEESSPIDDEHINGNGALNGHSNGFSHNSSGRPRIDVWTARENDALYIPRIDWSYSGLQEEPNNYDITVKLFFLPNAPAQDRAQYVQDALSLVRKELGVTTIDLLIASFPGMSFEGDCEWEADKRNASQGDIDEEAATWTVLEDLYNRGEVKALGISEFGTEKLAKFIKKVSVRPAVDQINIKDCCSVPPTLVKLAKAEGVELLVHTDCTDILPRGTLRELLGHGLQGAGVLADPVEAKTVSRWVVKYTAFVKDRGVIENKGYFAGAELVETSVSDIWRFRGLGEPLPPLAAEVNVVFDALQPHLDRFLVSPDNHVLFDPKPVLHQRQDDTSYPRDLTHRLVVDPVVLARVDVGADALLHAVESHALGHVALDVLADPDEAVDAQCDVHLARAPRRVHNPLLPLGPHDAAAAAGARDGDEDAVAQLAVLQGARVQAGGAVLVQLLDLGHHQVAFRKKRPDLQLVRVGALAEDAAGEVDGGDLEDGELRGADVDAPALRLDLDDAADDQVADLGGVAGAEGADGEELVGAGYGAGDGGNNFCRRGGNVGSVASVSLVSLGDSVA